MLVRRTVPSTVMDVPGHVPCQRGPSTVLLLGRNGKRLVLLLMQSLSFRSQDGSDDGTVPTVSQDVRGRYQVRRYNELS